MADCLLNGDPSPLQAVVSQPVAKVEERDRAADRLKEFLNSDSRVLCGPELAVSDWRIIRSEKEISVLTDRIRRLDADLETDGAFPSDPERRQARLEHLRVKYDQARSWLYAFAPGSKTLENLPPRPGSPVAALRFAHLLVPDDWPHLLRYAESDWARLVAYSLKQGQFEKRTLDWLVRFVPAAPPAVQALLQPYMRL
jgi:hypothetical protein